MGNRGDIDLLMKFGGSTLFGASDVPPSAPSDQVRVDGFWFPGPELAWAEESNLFSEPPYRDAPRGGLPARIEAPVSGPDLRSIIEVSPTPTETDVPIDDEGVLRFRGLRRIDVPILEESGSEAFVGAIALQYGEPAFFVVETDPVLVPVLLILGGFCLLTRAIDVTSLQLAMHQIREEGLVPAPVVSAKATAGASAKGGLFAKFSCGINYEINVYNKSGELVRRQDVAG